MVLEVNYETKLSSVIKLERWADLCHRIASPVKKLHSPRPGIEPGPSTWQAEILTTRLSRNLWRVWNLRKFKHSFLLCQLTRNNIFYSMQDRYKKEKVKKYSSLEPDLNQWPMDVCCTSIATLQSTALPTELSRVHVVAGTSLSIYLHLLCDLSDFPRQKIQTLAFGHRQYEGDVAQMVERSLSMREVRGSIPRISKQHFAIAHETWSWLTAVCLGLE